MTIVGQTINSVIGVITIAISLSTCSVKVPATYHNFNNCNIIQVINNNNQVINNNIQINNI